MKHLSFQANSGLLPAPFLEEVNKRLQAIVNVIGIDFAASEFFDKTSFRRVELIQDLSDANRGELRYSPNENGDILQIFQSLPVSEFDLNAVCEGFDYARSEAVWALSEAVKYYGCPSRDLEIRVFHMKADILTSKRNRERAMAPDEDDVDLAELEAAMSDDDFWKLISFIDKDALNSGADDALEALLLQLHERTVIEIKSFENHLTNKLYALDTKAHSDACNASSDDSFLYIRCYVVARGRAFYLKTLKKAAKMPSGQLFCEELLNVASRAWAHVKGREQSEFPAGFTENSYKTGSNPAFY